MGTVHGGADRQSSSAQVRRIADSIVGSQHRHVRNVRLAVALATIMLLALTIPVVVLAGRTTEGRPLAVTAIPVARPDTSTARIYAEVLDSVGGSGRVYVSTRLCAGMVDIARGRRGPCVPGTIGPRLQQQIRAATGGRLVFATRPPQPGPAVVVRLGSVTITGARAEVAYDLNCGPLCGHGETVLLTRTGGQWSRTGTGDYSWIS